MFEREKRMYERFHKMQQDDLITGTVSCCYSVTVSPREILYYQQTGGVVMQSLLYDQHWMFTVDSARARGCECVCIRAVAGYPVTPLQSFADRVTEA